jgi:hypothetical protein
MSGGEKMKKKKSQLMALGTLVVAIAIMSFCVESAQAMSILSLSAWPNSLSRSGGTNITIAASNLDQASGTSSWNSNLALLNQFSVYFSPQTVTYTYQVNLKTKGILGLTKTATFQRILTYYLDPSTHLVKMKILFEDGHIVIPTTPAQANSYLASFTKTYGVPGNWFWFYQLPGTKVITSQIYAETSVQWIASGPIVYSGQTSVVMSNAVTITVYY